MADTSALTHYSPEVLALWGEADEAASEKWRQDKINDFEASAQAIRPVERDPTEAPSRPGACTASTCARLVNISPSSALLSDSAPWLGFYCRHRLPGPCKTPDDACTTRCATPPPQAHAPLAASAQAGGKMKETHGTREALDAYMKDTVYGVGGTMDKTLKIRANPRVFFDIEIGGEEAGRVVMQLRADVVPKTAENFRQLCLKEEGEGFKASSFHRVIPGFM
eukprot:scaffold14920_cov95-Isochrysis_galbana.AAC.4